MINEVPSSFGGPTFFVLVGCKFRCSAHHHLPHSFHAVGRGCQRSIDHVSSTLHKMLMLRSTGMSWDEDEADDDDDDDDDDDPVKFFETRGKWWELIVCLPSLHCRFLNVCKSIGFPYHSGFNHQTWWVFYQPRKVI